MIAVESQRGTPLTVRGTAAPPSLLAVLPWGDVIEDFLDEINVSIEEFSSRMTGGWLFGYVEALQRYGTRAHIICFSARIAATVRSVHEPTGATLVILRTPAIYRRLRRGMQDPYGCSVHAMFGNGQGGARHRLRAAFHLAPYLATPAVRLAREIHRAGCTGVLCQEYESPRFDVAILAGMMLRLPVYATFQGGTWHRSGLERHLRSRTLRRAAGVIIGSSAEAARVRATYQLPAARISHIFNPLDLSSWRCVPRQEARRDLGISPMTRVVMWHGRVDIQRKGLDLLLEAWRTVCAGRPAADLLLMLIGDGVDGDRLDADITRTGVAHVRWIRDYVLDKSAICHYLCAADVYVFPSRHEGFPVAPLEAMACGLPIVAASAPGVIDIFEGGEDSGGLVVPVGDAGALAEAVGQLLDEPDRAEALGRCARARVERAFSPVRIGAQLQALLTTAAVQGA